MTKLLSFALAIAFITFTLFISCEKKLDKVQEVEIVTNENVIYGSKSSVLPPITEKAKEHCVQWIGFEDFDIESRSLNGNTLDQLRSKSERLVQYADTLAIKIPDTLNNVSITSRLVVVRTRANILFQEVNKSKVDSLRIEKAIDEMNFSITHLIYQLNEKFEKDEIDLLRQEAGVSEMN